MKRKALLVIVGAALLAGAPMAAFAQTDVFFGLNLGALLGPPEAVYAPPLPLNRPGYLGGSNP